MYLHIYLDTNIQSINVNNPSPPLLFEFSMLSHVPKKSNQPSNKFTQFPLFTDKYEYNVADWNITSFEDVLYLFFDKRTFDQKIKHQRKNPPELSEEKKQNNILITLRLLFPSAFSKVTTSIIQEGLEPEPNIKMNKWSLWSMIGWSSEEKQSYLFISNKIYSVISTVWNNDLIHNTIYRSFIFTIYQFLLKAHKYGEETFLPEEKDLIKEIQKFSESTKNESVTDKIAEIDKNVKELQKNTRVNLETNALAVSWKAIKSKFGGKFQTLIHKIATTPENKDLELFYTYFLDDIDFNFRMYSSFLMTLKNFKEQVSKIEKKLKIKNIIKSFEIDPSIKDSAPSFYVEFMEKVATFEKEMNISNKDLKQIVGDYLKNENKLMLEFMLFLCKNNYLEDEREKLQTILMNRKIRQNDYKKCMNIGMKLKDKKTVELFVSMELVEGDALQNKCSVRNEKLGSLMEKKINRQPFQHNMIPVDSSTKKKGGTYKRRRLRPRTRKIFV